jgi:hypothetical protein
MMATLSLAALVLAVLWICALLSLGTGDTSA